MTITQKCTTVLACLLYTVMLIWAVLLAGRADTARVLNYLAALVVSPLYVLAYYLSI